MKTWVNILSAGPQVPKEALTNLAHSTSVQVYSSVDNQVIGKTLRYEVRDNVDLWAEVEFEGTLFKRAAGILTKGPQGFSLHGVLATDLTREQILSLSPT